MNTPPITPPTTPRPPYAGQAPEGVVRQPLVLRPTTQAMAAAGAATAAAAGIGAATTTQSPPTTPPTTPTVQPHIGQAPPVVHHPQMVAIPNPQAMAAAAAGIAAVLNNPAANPLQHHYLQFQNPNIIHLLQGFRPPQGPAPDQP